MVLHKQTYEAYPVMNALPAGAALYRHINVAGPNNPAVTGVCNNDVLMGRLILDGGTNMRTRSAIAHVNSGLPAFAANPEGEPSCHCVHTPGYITVVWFLSNNAVVAEGTINDITPEDVIAAIYSLANTYKCWGSVVKGYTAAASFVFGHPLGPDILQNQARRSNLWGDCFLRSRRITMVRPYWKAFAWSIINGMADRSITQAAWAPEFQCYMLLTFLFQFTHYNTYYYY